jgi:hypothetical protein
MGQPMHRRHDPIRPLLPLLAVLVLAACQGGFDAAAPAERARAADVPPVVPAAVDPDACWAQTRVALPQGGAEDRLFAVPCPDRLTPDLWASVQRALQVRGHYAGPVTGAPDAATGEAVRRFQAPLGLDSPVLSLDGARHLGLMPWPRDRL